VVAAADIAAPSVLIAAAVFMGEGVMMRTGECETLPRRLLVDNHHLPLFSIFEGS